MTRSAVLLTLEFPDGKKPIAGSYYFVDGKTSDGENYSQWLMDWEEQYGSE